MTITWTPDAEELINKAPLFIRPMVKKKIEKIAGEKGFTTIEVDLVKEIKAAMMEKSQH
ncbi:MAG: PCP reductase family protein [Deltaproteobacteria bacterium]|nr:PCP reductase family protein [Deltaproteobacteria bacterium]